MHGYETTARFHKGADRFVRFCAQARGVRQDEHFVLAQRVGVFHVGLDDDVERQMIFHHRAENADGGFHVRGHPVFVGRERADVRRIDAAADPRTKRHLGARAGQAVKQAAAFADEHRGPLERFGVAREGLALFRGLIEMRERGLGVLLPMTLRGDAAIRQHGHLPQITLGARRLHVELTLLAEIRENPRGFVAVQPAMIAAGESGQQVASLIGGEIPKQFEKRRVEHAVHRVRDLRRGRTHPMPPASRPGRPRRGHEVGFYRFQRRCPFLHEVRVAIEPPLEVVAKLGGVHVSRRGNFARRVRAISRRARRAEALRPAAEAIHVVSIPVEALHEIDLQLDEPVAVRRIPAPEHVARFQLLDRDRFTTRRVDVLPIGMLRLQPRGHVEANHFTHHFRAFRVRRIDPHAQFRERLF